MARLDTTILRPAARPFTLSLSELKVGDVVENSTGTTYLVVVENSVNEHDANALRLLCLDGFMMATVRAGQKMSFRKVRSAALMVEV